MNDADIVTTILGATEPLRHPRGRRLPIYVCALSGVPGLDDGNLQRLLLALDARGIGLLARWDPGAGREQALAEALRIGRMQQHLGLQVAVEAVLPLYRFFDGDPATAHVDATGAPFFDRSFDPAVPIGCAFAAAHRYGAIGSQVEYFARAYEQAGLPIDFAWSDWEIDGPLEWNDGWAHCRRCVRCREHIPDIDDFAAFQRALRRVRSEMQRECYARPIVERFPGALVGNYGVYPHDGWRYWYDYYERFNPALPYRPDQDEPCRPWADEMAACGYTMGMPVLYTWYRTFDWYSFANPDYRWFYNLLKNVSTAARHRPEGMPLAGFFHHSTTEPPAQGLPAHFRAMSTWAYQEFVWHALLRGLDGCFLWCLPGELAHEIAVLHEPWAAALEYRELLEQGTPIAFDVPAEEGAVVSGLRCGDRILLRRTDFGPAPEVVEIGVGERRLAVRRRPGECQIVACAQER